jgi:hypothetical protein
MEESVAPAAQVEPDSERPAETESCGVASSDDVVGRWKETQLGFIIEIRPQADGYVLIDIADAFGMLPRPETAAEFRAVRDAPCTFRGRHIWGGQRWSTTWWGDDGGMTVEQLSKDSILVRFLDSRYSAGWTYVRMNPESR